MDDRDETPPPVSPSHSPSSPPVSSPNVTGVDSANARVPLTGLPGGLLRQFRATDDMFGAVTVDDASIRPTRLDPFHGSTLDTYPVPTYANIEGGQFSWGRAIRRAVYGVPELHTNSGDDWESNTEDDFIGPGTHYVVEARGAFDDRLSPPDPIRAASHPVVANQPFSQLRNIQNRNSTAFQPTRSLADVDLRYPQFQVEMARSLQQEFERNRAESQGQTQTQIQSPVSDLGFDNSFQPPAILPDENADGLRVLWNGPTRSPNVETGIAQVEPVDITMLAMRQWEAPVTGRNDVLRNFQQNWQRHERLRAREQELDDAIPRRQERLQAQELMDRLQELDDRTDELNDEINNLRIHHRSQTDAINNLRIRHRNQGRPLAADHEQPSPLIGSFARREETNPSHEIPRYQPSPLQQIPYAAGITPPLPREETHSSHRTLRYPYVVSLRDETVRIYALFQERHRLPLRWDPGDSFYTTLPSVTPRANDPWTDHSLRVMALMNAEQIVASRRNPTANTVAIGGGLRTYRLEDPASADSNPTSNAGANEIPFAPTASVAAPAFVLPAGHEQTEMFARYVEFYIAELTAVRVRLENPIPQPSPQEVREAAIGRIVVNFNGTVGEETQCQICLGAFHAKECENPSTVTHKHCKCNPHSRIYGRECIHTWLREQTTCPVCRNHVLNSSPFPRPRRRSLSEVLRSRWESYFRASGIPAVNNAPQDSINPRWSDHDLWPDRRAQNNRIRGNALMIPRWNVGIANAPSQAATNSYTPNPSALEAQYQQISEARRALRENLHRHAVGTGASVPQDRLNSNNGEITRASLETLPAQVPEPLEVSSSRTENQSDARISNTPAATHASSTTTHMAEGTSDRLRPFVRTAGLPDAPTPTEYRAILRGIEYELGIIRENTNLSESPLRMTHIIGTLEEIQRSQPDLRAQVQNLLPLARELRRVISHFNVMADFESINNSAGSNHERNLSDSTITSIISDDAYETIDDMEDQLREEIRRPDGPRQQIVLGIINVMESLRRRPNLEVYLRPAAEVVVFLARGILLESVPQVNMARIRAAAAAADELTRSSLSFQAFRNHMMRVQNMTEHVSPPEARPEMRRQSGSWTRVARRVRRDRAATPIPHNFTAQATQNEESRPHPRAPRAAELQFQAPELQQDMASTGREYAMALTREGGEIRNRSDELRRLEEVMERTESQLNHVQNRIVIGGERNHLAEFTELFLDIHRRSREALRAAGAIYQQTRNETRGRDARLIEIDLFHIRSRQTLAQELSAYARSLNHANSGLEYFRAIHRIVVARELAANELDARVEAIGPMNYSDTTYRELCAWYQAAQGGESQEENHDIVTLHRGLLGENSDDTNINEL